MRLARPAFTLAAALVAGLGPVPQSRGQSSPPPATFSVAADPAAAATRGSVELSPTTGSLVRAVPIEVPAFHGIEPRLALTYSSQAGNGFVGVGWAVSGFSVIERTRNGRGTPRFTSTDVYVLDGQELLPCAQAPTSPGCLAGGSHATKQETYAKITLASNTWTVRSRNGVRTELEPVYQVAGGTWRWGQKRVVDAHDNTVTYTWECVGGDCYPESVTYGPFVVTLYREATQRPDVLSFATGGLADWARRSTDSGRSGWHAEPRRFAPIDSRTRPARSLHGRCCWRCSSSAPTLRRAPKASLRARCSCPPRPSATRVRSEVAHV